MKVNALFVFVAFFAMVLFSYSTANAQNEDKTKEAVSKTKDAAVKTVTKAVESATKTTLVVQDALADSADKTKTAAGTAENKIKASSKSFGGNTVNVTENVAGETYEGGRWLTVTTWDGVKWVSKQKWFPNKIH